MTMDGVSTAADTAPAGNGIVSASAIPADELARLTDDIVSALKTVYDPEIPADIYELGLVYSCQLDPPAADGRQIANIQMTLTAPGCGMGDILAQDIQKRLEKLPEISQAKVEVVFDPPWNQGMMSEAARLQLGFY